jgi:hypothetical protein
MERIDALNNPENAHALLKAVYQNPEVPLPVRMRAAIACLPFESPKLAVTAVVTEQDFATLLEKRLKKIEAMKLIEAPQTHADVGAEIDREREHSGVGNGVDARLPPRLPDRRFRRI